MKNLIKNFKPGSDLTIMNVMYHYPKKEVNNNNEVTYGDDNIILVYRDNKTGEKHQETKYNVPYTYYWIKDEYTLDYPSFFVPKSHCEAITVPYRNVVKSIAEKSGQLNLFYENIRKRNRKGNSLFHTLPRVVGSDVHIEDYYRKLFADSYQNPLIGIEKAYIDIEVDSIDSPNDFPEPGECPINAISLFNEVDNTLYAFTFKDKRNPLVADYERYVQSVDFEQEFKDFLFKNVGGWKNAYRMNLSDIHVKTIFFNEEIDMIASVFRVINSTKPDFVLAWNMAFDIPYIIARVSRLGYEPNSIICHPDFPEKYCDYRIDHFHDTDPTKRGDYADISSYSVYLDQMIQFASRRKNESAFSSFRLDYIGGVVANAHKLDYHDIASNIREFPYKDFKLFMMYNMNDVMVQKCIEEKTGDIEYVFNKALVNNTRYSKIHRNTVYLSNRVRKFFDDNVDAVVGNNVNRFKNDVDLRTADDELNEDEIEDMNKKKKFKGAFVAKASLITDKPKVVINGSPIMLVYNMNDFDFKRMYPSIMQQYNIESYTQIGRLNIPNQVWQEENPLRAEDYSRVESFMEDLVSGDWLTFCKRWFGLAGYMEMLDDIMEYFENIVVGSGHYPQPEMIYGVKTLFHKVPPNAVKQIFRKVDPANPPSLFTMYKPMSMNDQENLVTVLKGVYERALF